MHKCKCGRSVPKEWKICGECAEMRSRVAMRHSMEGDRRRSFVAERHRVLTALAHRRPHTVEEPEPKKQTKRSKEPQVVLEQRSDTEDAIQIDRLLERKRILGTQKLRRKLEHESGKQSLKDWYLDD